MSTLFVCLIITCLPLVLQGLAVVGLAVVVVDVVGLAVVVDVVGLAVVVDVVGLAVVLHIGHFAHSGILLQLFSIIIGCFPLSSLVFTHMRQLNGDAVGLAVVVVGFAVVLHLGHSAQGPVHRGSLTRCPDFGKGQHNKSSQLMSSFAVVRGSAWIVLTATRGVLSFSSLKPSIIFFFCFLLH